jgi:hypothetical protein
MVLPFRFRTPSIAWRYAIVGVLASLPATAVLNRLPNSQATVGGGAMIVGALIAGGLAATRSVDSGATGLRAGVLGGVVGLFTFVVMVDTSAAWPLSRVLFWVFAGIAVLCVAPAFGLVFGRIGGWVANAVAPRSKTGVDGS